VLWWTFTIFNVDCTWKNEKYVQVFKRLRTYSETILECFGGLNWQNTGN